MGTIAVGVDGSDGSAHALRWAMAEAARRGWTVAAVLAWGYLDQHHKIVAERFDPNYTSEAAKGALDSYVEAALGIEQAAAIQRRVVSDLPPRALIEASESAALLVVGARGLGGFRGLLLGSVSQRCLHEAKCPVAVIRPDETDAPADVAPRVVVGIDGSKTSRNALTWAADEARARDATLEVVHAWHPPYVGGFPFTGVVVDYQLFEDSARDLVAGVLDGIDLDGLPGPVERTIVCNGAASALLEAAHRAHVVVLGARGLGGVKRFLLGSVSHQVALHATRPVIVVPTPDDD